MRSLSFHQAIGVAASAAVTLAMVALFGPSLREASAAERESADSRLFELRIYTANDGKLDALHSRFRDHTNDLFKKHGMTLVGYWTPTDGDKAANTLVYILAYPDQEAREASWKAFTTDPDWLSAYRDSTKDGRLVRKVDSTFLAPTDYSPMK